MSEHLADLREALQEHVPNDGDDLGVLTGFVVVAEWRTGEDDTVLTRVAGDINDEWPAIWTVKGWLWHALETAQRSYDDAADEDEDDDGD